MKKATLVVEGLGSVEVTDLESYEVAESFMKFLRKRVTEEDSPPVKSSVVETVAIHDPHLVTKMMREHSRDKMVPLKNHSLNKEGKIDRTVWSDEELNYLLENHKRLTAHSIADHLGRTVNSVKSMGYKKGFSFRNKKRKGVKRGSYHKRPEETKQTPALRPTTPEPMEYRSLAKRIRACKPKLVIDKFLEENPDVKKGTLTTVLSRMIEKRQATQITPNEVQIHDTTNTNMGHGLA